MNKHTKQKKKVAEDKKQRRLEALTYKGITFESFFEVDVAKYLTSCKIRWERNTKRFPTFVDGSIHYYVPDFYLPDVGDGTFLETKGIWFSTLKKRKTFQAVADHRLPWILLMLKDWKIRKHILKEKIMEASF